MALIRNYNNLIIYILIKIVTTQAWKAIDSWDTCGQLVGREYRKTPINRTGEIGAKKAISGDFPFIVSIQDKEGKHFCAGSIIHPEWILTAASCFVERHVGDASTNKIRAGILYTNRGVDYSVKTLETHELFSTEYHQNDIALVKLSSPLNFTQGMKLSGRGAISAICLPEANTEIEGTGTTVGWGFTVAKPVNLLHAADVTIFNCDQDCYCKNEYQNFNQKIMICAGKDESNQNVTRHCQGDVGGPLVGIGADNRATLVGVVSSGEGCGETHKHGVYTRVSKFIAWIEKVINAN